MQGDLKINSYDMRSLDSSGEVVLDPAPLENGTQPKEGPLVRVRGRVDGVVISVEWGNWPEILQQLDGHLKQSADFFQGSQVSVAVGERELTAAHLYQLNQLLLHYGVRLWAIETSNQATSQAAAAQKIAAALVETTATKLPTAAELAALSAADLADPATDLERNENYERYTPRLHRGTLRSGQVLRHLGPIVLIGDVNPGAEVISGSDIFIWGRLRGIAHAGATGSEHAVVAAIDLEPTQLRIGRQIAVSPSTKLGAVKRWFWRASDTKPEMAHISDGQIVVEPWDERRSRTSAMLSG